MTNNILDKIIKKKEEKILNLKKTIDLNYLDEISPYAKTNVIQLKNNKITEIIINPNEFNINSGKLENIIGGDSKFNANKIIDIFKGEDNDFSKAVCLNAAAGLIVNETFDNFKNAYDNAREQILSGNTIKYLEKLRND